VKYRIIILKKSPDSKNQGQDFNVIALLFASR